MKPNSKELEVIKISETFYNNKDKSFQRKYLFIKFKFKNYDVSNVKSLVELWNRFGLYNNNKFQFSDDEKLECINKWYKILYSNDFDIITDYNNKLAEFQKHMNDYYKDNPPNMEVHINWNFPSPENYIEEMGAVFGNYNT